MTNTPDAKEFFFDSLARAAKEVMSQIAGCDIEVDICPGTPAEFALDVYFVLESSLEGGFSLRFSAKDVVTASSLLMGEETGDGAALTEDQREAAAELSRQICGSLATTLRGRFGTLELRNDASVGGTVAEACAVRQLNVRAGNRALAVQITLTEKLSRSLERNNANRNQEHTDTPDRPSATSSSSLSGASSPPVTERAVHALRDSNLAILLDLELPVTLRFGTCEMLLKDVMELTSGSVVELDRNVREPADLLIDNKLIARGEVVLVEGNYGLRILEVVNERERLACLP